MNPEMLEFIDMLTGWHVRKVENLRDVQEGVKEGTTLKVGDDGERDIQLTARDASMFKLGLEAALLELGKLPFTVSRHDDDESDGEE